MTTDTSNPLVRRYLDDLRATTRQLPRGRREELFAEIEAHIADALPPDASETQVRDVLEQLGEPGAIAEEERERLGIARPRSGALEWIAIVMLLIGGLIIPIAGWFVGVVLLWSSRVWTVRDKLLGTLVVPGGLLLPVYAGLYAVNMVSGEVPRQTAGTAILVVLLVAPILTAIHLARKAVSAR